MPSQRRQSHSLLELCFSKTNILILDAIAKKNIGWSEIEKARRFIKTNLTSSIRQKILSDLVPFDDGANARWKFGCLSASSRNSCKIHSECKLMFNNAPKLLRLLLGNDLSSLKINLRKISAANCEESLEQIDKSLRRRSSNQLTEIIISGAHSGIDCYLSIFEDLCYFLKSTAPNLQTLHLAVGSNDTLRSCSKMPKLCSLTIERSHHLNHRGLQHLSDIKSYSKFGLQVCHLGVFKHHSFNKVDVANFLEEMVNLTSFSLLDDSRALVNQEFIGSKVLSYSALKLAMTKAIFRDNDEKEKECKNFQCALKELKVVDRKLNPQYLLEACPQLQHLLIDWQEELSEVPFVEYPTDWFHKMTKNPDWHQLSQSLTSLNIVFPRAHSEIGFTCDPEMLVDLLKNTKNLQKLTFKGLKGEPVPLDLILQRVPNLRELILIKCNIDFSANLHQKHTALKTLHILDDEFQMVAVEIILHRISNLVPNLEELILRPTLPLQFKGFLLLDVWVLSRLMHLKKLEITLSSADCANNMPEVVYVLRSFPALRYLTISWGTYVDMNNHRMARLISWLQTALDADNANIYIQASYDMHSSLYLSPPEIST